LIARSEGPVAGQIEKAFVFKAETKYSRCPFPIEAGAAVGTRLHGALANTLILHRDFKPLPIDRKLGSGEGLEVVAFRRGAWEVELLSLAGRGPPR
jgi:hypothetical protein